ncbi:hypothetical protein [Variovorax saccharolyticus]|uniref:hypothetical protein n=1 Tax=Variovorax saccharolyticus TaxID=3053516 RepID=UPI002578A061|nr:hypothetical protein [Variovorax sp. J31P216]MDM0029698.1 hypothetical protein [Variovorax sp. J31P216]
MNEKNGLAHSDGGEMPAPSEQPATMSLPGWTTRVEAAAVWSDGSCYHADVSRNGNLLCRVSVAGSFSTREAAASALERKLWCWIAEFEARDHLGSNAAMLRATA